MNYVAHEAYVEDMVHSIPMIMTKPASESIKFASPIGSIFNDTVEKKLSITAFPYLFNDEINVRLPIPFNLVDTSISITGSVLSLKWYYEIVSNMMNVPVVIVWINPGGYVESMRFWYQNGWEGSIKVPDKEITEVDGFRWNLGGLQ